VLAQAAFGPKRTVSCPEYCFAAFSKAALQRLPEQNKGDQPWSRNASRALVGRCHGCWAMSVITSF